MQDYKALSDWDFNYLSNMAEKHKTPLYITDTSRIEDNYNRLRSAFGSETDIFYAMKANASQSVLKTLLPLLDGIECGSLGEVKRVLYAVSDLDVETTIQYTLTNQPTDDLKTFINLVEANPNQEFITTLNDIRTAYRLIGNGYSGDICLRLNPGIGVGHHEKVKTGKDAKFGIQPDEVENAVAVIESSHANLVGVHAHAGSGILQDEKEEYLEMVETIFSLASDVQDQLEDSSLDFVDIGGGIGVPYEPEDIPLDVDEVAAAIKELQEELIPNPTLRIEPGRVLVADATVLLTQVTTIKEVNGTQIVGVDAGMTTLIRPALYDAYHPTAVVADNILERPIKDTTIAGPICESSDVFFTEREFPEVSQDEFIVIGNAGAYGYEMASVFHSQPRPKTLITDGQKTKIERVRESIEDVCQYETGASF